MASSGATKDGTTKLTSWASKGQTMRAARQTRYLIKLVSILVPHGRSSFLAALVESDAQGSPAPRGGACGEGPANKWGTGAASALGRLMIFGCKLHPAPAMKRGHAQTETVANLTYAHAKTPHVH